MSDEFQIDVKWRSDIWVWSLWKIERKSRVGKRNKKFKRWLTSGYAGSAQAAGEQAGRKLDRYREKPWETLEFETRPGPRRRVRGEK